MLLEVQEVVATFLKLTVSIGVSAPLHDILDIHQGFVQASEALAYRFYEGEGALVHFDRIDLAEPGVVQEPWSDFEWERLVEKRDEACLLQMLEQGYATILQGPKNRPEFIREVWVHLVHLLEGFARRLGGDLYSVPLHEDMYPYHAVRSLERNGDIYLWFQGWIPVYLNHLKQLSNQQYRTEVQTVLSTIKERFDQPLKSFGAGKTGRLHGELFECIVQKGNRRNNHGQSHKIPHGTCAGTAERSNLQNL